MLKSQCPIPENVTINSTAYSCHIVYYSLVTEEGKIESTMNYPGTIKVTVIRETRVQEVAR